jgi:trk system potassium uptake protein TrkA
VSSIQFGSGEVEIAEVTITGRLVGHFVRDLSVPGEMMPVAIVRRGRAFLPTPGVLLEEGDVVHIAVLATATSLLESMIQ